MNLRDTLSIAIKSEWSTLEKLHMTINLRPRGEGVASSNLRAESRWGSCLIRLLSSDTLLVETMHQLSDLVLTSVPKSYKTYCELSRYLCEGSVVAYPSSLNIPILSFESRCSDATACERNGTTFVNFYCQCLILQRKWGQWARRRWGTLGLVNEAGQGCNSCNGIQTISILC